MQFHHHGYVSGDPRVQEAAGYGVERASELPATMDVLIVGSGPAGMLLAAQLSQYPDVNARLVERRPSRLEVGQADGIQARSVETFQAFGFAEEITAEAYRITSMNFWAPDPARPEHIHRTQRTVDDEHGVSEFPHLIVNQARVLDYFARAAQRGPGRITPDYGYEFVDLRVEESGEHPVVVTLRVTAGEREGTERIVRARYVVGCDGARSRVRQAIGAQHLGEPAKHAWGVMDALAVTDFPDIRTKCAINSRAGSILLIPREGGYLFRMYVDLGDVADDDARRVRDTPLADIIARANDILSPYTLDVRDVAWWSVYEVGHRVTDRFDDVEVQAAGTRTPRVFICGDACHTHSAKAGQGMNVSMQDGFNLGWKLGAVVSGRSPERLLATYTAERQQIAQDLIDFDREWSALMARRPEDFASPEELGDFYVRTAEFPAGFMTQYPSSMIVGTDEHQPLAEGFTVGKRFKSVPVVRVGDTVPAHLGHHARADGRWRVYVFADAAGVGGEGVGVLAAWSDWMAADPSSPLVRHTPADGDPDAVVDLKLVLQQPHDRVDLGAVPTVFLPRVGPFGLIDYEKVYAVSTLPGEDAFEQRGIDRDRGAVVVVRPDQYVAAVLPLDDPAALGDFFDQHRLPVR